MPDIATRGADIPSAYTGGRNLGIEWNSFSQHAVKAFKINPGYDYVHSTIYAVESSD
jgi:hypothetical protein